MDIPKIEAISMDEKKDSQSKEKNVCEKLFIM